jgi:hypothetical protein
MPGAPADCSSLARAPVFDALRGAWLQGIPESPVELAFGRTANRAAPYAEVVRPMTRRIPFVAVGCERIKKLGGWVFRHLGTSLVTHANRDRTHLSLIAPEPAFIDAILFTANSMNTFWHTQDDTYGRSRSSCGERSGLAPIAD